MMTLVETFYPLQFGYYIIEVVKYFIKWNNKTISDRFLKLLSLPFIIN